MGSPLERFVSKNFLFEVVGLADTECHLVFIVLSWD